MRPTLLRLAPLPFLLCVGCAYTVSGLNARCSELIPKSWAAGVEGADIPESAILPDGHEDARPWQAGFVAQSGQLEKANGRTADAIAITGNCERMIASAEAPRRWWQIWK